jgi:hypothetical protein
MFTPLRNPLAFPGRKPGFNPSHFVLSSSPSFSAVATGNFFRQLNVPKASNNSGNTGSIDGLLGPCVQAGYCQFPSDLMTVAGSGITLAFIGRWQTVAVALGLSVGSGLAIGNNGSNALYLYNGGTVASMTATGFVAGDPVFCVGSISANAGTKSVTLGMRNLRTGRTLLSATTGTFTPLSGAADVNICNYWLLNAGWGAFNMATAAVIGNYINAPLVEQWLQAPWDFWFPPTVLYFMQSSVLAVQKMRQVKVLG